MAQRARLLVAAWYQQELYETLEAFEPDCTVSGVDSDRAFVSSEGRGMVRCSRAIPRWNILCTEEILRRKCVLAVLPQLFSHSSLDDVHHGSAGSTEP